MDSTIPAGTPPTPRRSLLLEGDEQLTQRLVEGLFTSRLFCREFLDCTKKELKHRVQYIISHRPVLRLISRPDEYVDNGWLCWLKPYSFVAIPASGMSEEKRWALAQCITGNLFCTDVIEHNPSVVKMFCFARNDIVQRYFDVRDTLQAIFTLDVYEVTRAGMSPERAKIVVRDSMHPVSPPHPSSSSFSHPPSSPSPSSSSSISIEDEASSSSDDDDDMDEDPPSPRLPYPRGGGKVLGWDCLLDPKDPITINLCTPQRPPMNQVT